MIEPGMCTNTKTSLVIHGDTMSTPTNSQTISHLANYPFPDLLAACALSFKPLFHLIDRALHLSQLVSHTRSYLWTHNNTIGGKTTNSHNNDYHNTLKSSDSRGLTKLYTVSHSIDEEANIDMQDMKSQAGLSVTVTRNRAEDKRRDSEHESPTVNERYNEGEYPRSMEVNRPISYAE